MAVLAGSPAFAQDKTDETHRKVYEETRDCIVAIRVMAPMGTRSGTGVFIDDEGTILTSYSVCPEGSTELRVWASGPRLYTYKKEEVEIIGHSKKDEVTRLRVKRKKKEKP